VIDATIYIKEKEFVQLACTVIKLLAERRMTMKERVIKRIPALILSVIIVMAMMPILPGVMQRTYAAEADATKLDVAKENVTINSDSITGKDENGNNVTAADPDGYYLYSSSQTGNTVTINCDCTIYLGGLDILVSHPSSSTDYGQPNPININGDYNVTLELVDGKTNKLASEEGIHIDGDDNLRHGSGKAAIRVPSGATLTINGDTGVLNATGAQGANYSANIAWDGGGAGIGGDGGYTLVENNHQNTYVPAEASGTITINGGIINAAGGDHKGYWGAGGSGIGGGGGRYTEIGGAGGAITISGGNVTVKAGKDRTFTPIGAGGSAGHWDPTFKSRGATGQISVTGGTLTLASDMEIYQDEMLSIGPNGTLIVENDVTLTVNKDFTNNGTLTNDDAIKYAINYELNGGTDDANNPEYYTSSESITLKSPTRTGYIFEGWYIDQDLKNKADDVAIPAGSTGVKTFYAKWMKYEPVTPTTYEPIVTPSGSGTTTVTPTNPEAGDTVTITPTPNDGYEVDTITVTDKDGNTVDVKDNGNGTYSFTQPAGSVTVTVTYKKKDTPVTPVVTTNPILNLKAVPAGKTVEKLTWTKVKGAEGYDVYFAKCGNKFRKIKSTKSLTLKKKGLKKGTAYKYKVHAYKMQDGKKVYITSAYVSHAIAGGYNSKYTDAKSITAAKKSITLEAGKTVRVRATQKKYKSGRKFLKTSHAALFRYKSTDKSVATVDRNGKVTAKNAGTCTIYIYAQNGLAALTTITVK
jgi:uncharacterized repeat protein (TIGR02543 family)